MYRNITTVLSLVVVAGLVDLVLSGCNQDSDVANSEAISDTSLTSIAYQGCCGKCAAEEKDQTAKDCCGKCKQQESVASKDKDGCCGKCQGETSTATANVDGCCGKCQEGAKKLSADECCGMCKGEKTAVGKDGCCGKCEGEIKKDEASATGGCSKNCNACAEGNSENCKCEGDASPAADVEKGGKPQANSMRQDRDIFHYLLQHHEKITRTVKELDKGVQTVTESDDPAITDKLQEHVASMHRRIEEGRPLRMWDDLYREIFKHHDKIKMEIENTDNGISVTETSDDPHVVKLIQQHAKVVSGFAKRGFEEAREYHPVAKESQR